MNEFVAVTSTNIAKILNMYPEEGRDVEGADADIVVWDPKARRPSAKKQQSVIDYNVFEGVEVTGLPKYVFTRGELAVDNGKVKAHPGHGEFVGREPGMAVNKALSTWKELVAPRKVERLGIPGQRGVSVYLFAWRICDLGSSCGSCPQISCSN
jgi:dihydropyrimidinase